MDRGVFGARTQQANESIANSAKELGELFPELADDVQAMETAGSHTREPAYKQLFRSEALAILLAKLVVMAKGGDENEVEPVVETDKDDVDEGTTGESESDTGEPEDPSTPIEPPVAKPAPARAPVRVAKRS